jgi:hypothetical protein
VTGRRPEARSVFLERPNLNLRPRVLLATDRVQTIAVVTLIFGSVACFGGAIWWFRPAVAVLVFLLVGAKLTQFVLIGRVPVFQSPLFLLWLMALLVAMLQLVPLPPSLASRLSPGAHEIYSYGNLPALARIDLPSVHLDLPLAMRSPATLDRAATLRWLVGAALGMGIFWAVGHFADRLGRLYLIWGCIVAAFVLNAGLGLVQIVGQTQGMYGFLQPGNAPIWAPSEADMLESPGTAVLRRLGPSPNAIGPVSSDSAAFERVALVPERPLLFGTMMGGTGGFLALGSLALPLALAIVLHVISPRGSRESLSYRLKHTGQGGLAALLVVMLVASSCLVGLMAGPWLILPYAVGLAAVGLPRAAGSRFMSIGLTCVLLASLGLGASLAGLWPLVTGGRLSVAPVPRDFSHSLWIACMAIFRDFPLLGTGLGSFGAIYPYVKTQDASSTTALSSVLQCAVESGAVGLGLLALATLWFVCRLPASLKCVGAAERTLAYGLIGAVLSFGLWSVVHWTIELPAVAIAATALLGTCNRWLAGGTDLFVERG